MKQSIRLKGISDEVKGRIWESDTLLRAGRVSSLEIVIDDSSVSRRHAEVRFNPSVGWVVQDLNSTNGTFVNGKRIEDDRVLKPRDLLQFGKIAIMVENADNGAMTPPNSPIIDTLVEQATTHSSWDEAIEDLVFDKNRNLRPGEQLIALLRAGHHLVHIEKVDDLLHSILNDAVQVLDAQRGAIVLAEEPEGQLQLRAWASGLGEPPIGRFHYSKKLAKRCFDQERSILCGSVHSDPELAAAQSIADGAMSSVVCVLLRTPRKKLGVLHLDRSFFHKAFTDKDLDLADALAAHVSAGIECAQLVRNQRKLFNDTIVVLAQAVELKDQYTGGHTRRVTKFARMLGTQLKLSSDQLELLDIGTPLHDIGKIGIDDAILRKPGKLTAEEFEIMKTHTTKGEAIVSMIPGLDARVHPIIRSHHERWDGRGYPDGTDGESIPLLARIVAVVDAFDAMTSDRPYHPDKKGMPPQQAFTELEQQAGKQFDPQCAAGFLAIAEHVLEIMNSDHNTAIVATKNRPESKLETTPARSTR